VADHFSQFSTLEEHAPPTVWAAARRSSGRDATAKPTLLTVIAMRSVRVILIEFRELIKTNRALVFRE
jgi:hypothetical protein